MAWLALAPVPTPGPISCCWVGGGSQNLGHMIRNSPGAAVRTLGEAVGGEAP